MSLREYDGRGRPVKIQFPPVGAGVVLTKKGLGPYARGDSPYLFAHRGTSMNPTLSERDLLEIVPYGERPVRAGDVLFFLSPLGDKHVVHRAVCVTSKGIQTHGDNNRQRDKERWLSPIFRPTYPASGNWA